MSVDPAAFLRKVRRVHVVTCIVLRQLTPVVIGPLCMFATGYMIYASEPDAQRQSEAFFSEQVQPLLQNHCWECHSHSAGESSGELMLDSLAAMESGGSRGTAVLPGKPGRSLLLQALRYSDPDLQMPPDGKLTDAEIDVIRTWIADGLVVPDAMRGTRDQSAGGASIAANASVKTHWAYQLPRVWSGRGTKGQAATRVDEILLTQLEAHGIGFSPRADRHTLARRLSYDLIGLPPTQNKLTRFLSDPRPDEIATVELVDRLLASPHFGERWARYWMDVARYADNKGYVFKEDREYPEAYKYRDWLIDAFNRDLPYDRFIAQQLAADLLAEDGVTDDLPALGFLTLGRRFLNNKLDIIDDRLDVVSRGLMGMTLACARCHDHKYDPISQADYYSLAGVFLNTAEPGGEPWPHRLEDSKKNRDAFILLRGSIRNIGRKVPRRFVSFLAPSAQPFPVTGSGRAELAQQIASRENPLTARVMAGRVWMWLTGTSLVESPSDFGTRCPPPRQLALLDQLALSLMENDWSLKQLIRQIVLSDFYAQQSLDRKQCSDIDPANELYWRMNRRRLDFEALRDTLLSRTDNLDLAIHGIAQKINTAPFSNRRTVYSYIDRQNLPSVFRTFDMAGPDSHSPRRPQTSVPQQGLFLLNSDFIAARVENLAARLRGKATASSAPVAIDLLFKSVLGREPSDDEMRWLLEFVQRQPTQNVTRTDVDDDQEKLESASKLPQPIQPKLDAWAQAVQALLLSNELAFVD